MCSCFRWTYVKPVFRYNSKLDIVDGFIDHGHLRRDTREVTEILVSVLRGLNSRWKKPTSYYFTGKVLNSARIKLLVEFNTMECVQAGLKVIAISSDGDIKNRKLSKDLGCTDTDSSFMLGSKEIVHIYDVPHIIKLLRNYLMKRELLVTIGG